MLVVEGDHLVRRSLITLLEDDGYLVLAIERGSAVLAVAPSFRADLVVVDGGPPGMTRADVAHGLRQSSDVPIIFVTGPDSIDDVRGGFNFGTDDYILKPIDPEELSWRVRAALRRCGRAVTQVWKCGDLVVDERARSVARAGTPVPVTPTEFRLLSVLIRNRKRVVVKGHLRAQVGSGGGDDHLVEVHLSSLRRKLEVLGPRMVHTVRGAGYILRPDCPERS